MSPPNGLSLVVFSGGYDRVHYALSMAVAAAATGQRVSLLFAGRALRALLRDNQPPGEPGWHGLDPADDGVPPATRDHRFSQHGIATFEELLAGCAALGVPVIACEMGLRALDLPAATQLRPDLPITIGGIVGFLNTATGNQILFV